MTVESKVRITAHSDRECWYSVARWFCVKPHRLPFLTIFAHQIPPHSSRKIFYSFLSQKLHSHKVLIWECYPLSNQWFNYKLWLMINPPVTISLSDRQGHFFQSGFWPRLPVTIPQSHRPGLKKLGLWDRGMVIDVQV